MKNFTLFIFSMFIAFAINAQSVTIAQIQGQADASPYADQIVTTQGIITAIMYHGFVIQDGPGADGWNGVFVYVFTDFMDEEPWASEIVVGAEISLTAVVTEYYGLTELKDMVTHSILSTGNEVPAPVVLPTGSVAQEKYEGIMVKVQNAEVTEYTPDNHGYFEVNDGSGAANVDDEGHDFFTDDDLAPVLGTVYDITGVVAYSWDAYRINPESLDDIVLSGTSVNGSFIPQQLAIYPNPVTNDNFNIESDKEIVSVEVINVLGQTIFELPNADLQRKVQVNMVNPNEGVYMVKIDFADNTSKIKKILVK